MVWGHWSRTLQGISQLLLVSSLHLETSLLPSLGSPGLQRWLFPHLSPNIPGQEMFNTSGVVMTRNGSMVSANFDGAVTISVIALSNILHASCSLPEEYQNRTEGLMGKEQAGACLCSRSSEPPARKHLHLQWACGHHRWSFLSQPPWNRALRVQSSREGGGTSSATSEAHFPSS